MQDAESGGVGTWEGWQTPRQVLGHGKLREGRAFVLTLERASEIFQSGKGLEGFYILEGKGAIVWGQVGRGWRGWRQRHLPIGWTPEASASGWEGPEKVVLRRNPQQKEKKKKKEEIHSIWVLGGIRGEEGEDSSLPPGDRFVLEEREGILTEKGVCVFSCGV